MSHRPFELHGLHLPHFMQQREKLCPAKARPYVLAATILASSLAFIDSTVIGIAIPVLQEELQAKIADLQWVVNAYALMLGALILVGGGLGDRLGRRRIFVIGIVVFTVASVLCAVAQTINFLIAARAGHSRCQKHLVIKK